MQNLVTANEVAQILNCTRTNVERLQLTKKLIPISTIYPKYYFTMENVSMLLRAQQAKSKKNV